MTEWPEDPSEVATTAPAVSCRDELSSLPPGWTRATLGDLVSTKSGNSKLIKGKLAASPSEGSVPAYSASGQDVWTSLAEWHVDGVVLSAVGARCGKTFLASGSWTAIANTHVLIPKASVDPRWLWYLTNDESFWIKGGTAQPFVKMGASKSIPVLLPPVEDQRRIAATLDAAEALRVKRHEALRKLEDLINAVFVDMFRENATDMSWEDTTLGEIADVVSGATPKTSVERYWGGEVCWATPRDLSDLEGPYISATSRTLTAEGLKSCSASVLPSESVLLSSRAPIGYVAINKVPMATNQGFKSLVPDPSRIDPRFLCVWLRRHRAQIESLGSGATFKEVSKRVVEGIHISLPPLTEQRQFGHVLDTVEAMRIRLRDTLVELDVLCASLQQRAFRGEL